MLDIPSLERKWLKYKIKSYLPHTIITLSSILILIVIAVFFSSNDSTTLDHNQTVVLNKTAKPSSTLTPLNEVILEPSMQFMQTITPSAIEPKLVSVQAQVPHTKAIIPPKNPPLISPQSITILPPPSPTPTPLAPTVSTKAPTIKHGSNAIDISEIEERFKNNPSPQLGLYLARYYYDHKDYNEAYNYALKTNSINKDIEESWLIFSKSLIKLGKIDQAKKTLQYYISQSHSDNAKDLLNSIEQGNVK